MYFQLLTSIFTPLKLSLPYRISFLLLVVTLLGASLYINKMATGFRNIIHADAAGYYCWLPALLVYQDHNFSFTDTVFTENEYYPSGFFRTTLVPVSTGDTMNKYSAGAAVSSIPFFLAAHSYGIFKGEHKGFEMHYQLSWLLSALFFICLGMYFLFRIAHHFSQPFYVPFLLCALIVFGTNFFHYSTWDAGYSHAYTFAYSAAAFWFLIRAKATGEGASLIFAALCMGMMVLVRPFNVLLLPVMLVAVFTFKEFWHFILHNKVKMLWGLTVFGVVCALHFLGNYWQTGDFFVYSYGNEKFHFDKPHFFKFLFGAEVGAFVYSPLFLLLIILSMVFLFRQKRMDSAVVLTIAFTGIVWLLSCWDTWTFGCTMGNRPLVDWYVIFTVPVIIHCPQINKKWLRILIVILATGTYYNQVLHYQYRNWIMDWCNRNWSDFKDVFLKTDDAYRFYMSDDWSFPVRKDNKILRMDLNPGLHNISGSETLILQSDSLPLDTVKNWRIQFKCMARFEEKRGDDILVVQLSNSNQYFGYYQKFIKKEIKKADEWQPFVFEFQIPRSALPVNAAFYIRNHDQVKLEIRDAGMELIGFE